MLPLDEQFVLLLAFSFSLRLFLLESLFLDPLFLLLGVNSLEPLFLDLVALLSILFFFLRLLGLFLQSNTFIMLLRELSLQLLVGLNLFPRFLEFLGLLTGRLRRLSMMRLIVISLLLCRRRRNKAFGQSLIFKILSLSRLLRILFVLFFFEVIKLSDRRVIDVAFDLDLRCIFVDQVILINVRLAEHLLDLALVVLLVGLILFFHLLLLFFALRFLFFLLLVFSILLLLVFSLLLLTLLAFLLLSVLILLLPLLFGLLGALVIELLVLGLAVLEETLEPSNQLSDKVRLLRVPVPLGLVIIAICHFELDIVEDLFAQFVFQCLLLLSAQSLLDNLEKGRFLVQLRLHLHQHGRRRHAIAVNLV